MEFVKKLLIVFLAFGCFAGSFLLEQASSKNIEQKQENATLVTSINGLELIRNGKSEAVNEEKKLLPGDTLKTTERQTATITLNQKGVLRMGPESVLILKTLSSTEGDFFLLEKGELWINTVFTPQSLTVVTKGVLLLPRRSAFNVNFDEEKTVVKAHTGEVEVKIVSSSFGSGYSEKETGKTINSFLITSGGQATLYAEKIKNNAKELEKLLYSKLIKEFQYGLIGKSDWQEDTWLKQNIAADEELIQKLAQNILRSINSRGIKVGSLTTWTYQLEKTAGNLFSSLTFAEQKAIQRLREDVFIHLHDAEHFIIFGRANEARERLQLFSENFKKAYGSKDKAFQQQLYQDLEKKYEELNFVLFDDPLALVKSAMADLLYQYSDSRAPEIRITLLREYLHQAYKLAENNPLAARTALAEYSRRLIQFIKEEKSKFQSINNFLTEENQIMDNLLRQFPQFYQDTFFEFKHFLEIEWLALLPENAQKNEERQTIISNKIDFLKQLQSFFLYGKISLKDAKAIVFRLINEMKDLQTDDELGINQLFAIRLKDYGQFLRFLNTTDFTGLQGASTRKRYEEFLANQKEQVSTDQAVQEFLQEQTPIASLTLDQILLQIKADFKDIKAENVKIGSLGNKNQQFVRVEGTVENISFQAQYDWKKKLVSEVRSGTKLIALEPVKLSALSSLLKPKKIPRVKLEAENIDSSGSALQQNNTEKTQKIAKILLLQKFKNYNFFLKEENIQIQNIETGSFLIKEAQLIADSTHIFTFNFDNTNNRISALNMKTGADVINFSETIALSELENFLQKNLP